jgi:UDP-N-acetyl-2-amino-2-deoxyglucuronate dehydrogenase
MQAIKETGNELIAALDPSDSVGILDRFFSDVHFFTEFERFDRHIEKLRRANSGHAVDYVSICSPNYLHDAHMRFALRIGANVICEKPLVLNPRNLKMLVEMEKETGKKINAVLQLRYHQSIIKLRKRVQEELKKDPDKKYDIDLVYMTPRGRWYFASWKGDVTKSGGVATNIGVHFFDMLMWIFGDMEKVEVHYNNPKKMGGLLKLKHAHVRWFLSVDKTDLGEKEREENKAYRSITIDGEELEFSDGFTDLHTEVYKNVLAGNGFGIADALPSIQAIHDIRELPVGYADEKYVHPKVRAMLK